MNSSQIEIAQFVEASEFRHQEKCQELKTKLMEVKKEIEQLEDANTNQLEELTELLQKNCQKISESFYVEPKEPRNKIQKAKIDDSEKKLCISIEKLNALMLCKK